MELTTKACAIAEPPVWSTVGEQHAETWMPASMAWTSGVDLPTPILPEWDRGPELEPPPPGGGPLTTCRGLRGGPALPAAIWSACCGETPGEILRKARRVLGLSTKDLAPVFRITRQDLYHFCDHPERFGAFHRQRFLAVSEQINRLSSILQVSPGSRAKHLVIEGDTLLGLLSAPELDPGRIERVAALLAEHVRHSSSPHQRHQRTIDQLTRHA